MSGLITTEPCESCSRARTERETGAGYCATYGLGFDECYEWRETREIEEIAGQVATLYQAVGDHEKRRELAISTADGFANALYMQGKGAEFDSEAFIRACNLALMAVTR